MAYDPPTFEEVRADLLDTYRNNITGAKVAAGSENYARASVAAAGTVLICQGVKTVERQIFPDTADLDSLVRHGGLYEIERRPATAATSGKILLTGTNATVVAAGLVGVYEDGTEFETTSGGVIALGVLDVDAIATTEGSAGNLVVDDVLTIQSPPAGVDGEATVSQDFSGGTDIESQAELLARVLARMRAGNAGGTDTDYEQWVLTVAGVVSADCLPTRRGPGTVSVAVYTEGAGGYREPADAAKRAEVLAYLETVRPVTAEVDVPAVTEVTSDVEVEILEYEPGYAEAGVRADVETAIKAYIYALLTGGTQYYVSLTRAISAVGGVRDFELHTPIDNVTCAVSSTTVEVLIPGVVTVT